MEFTQRPRVSNIFRPPLLPQHLGIHFTPTTSHTCSTQQGNGFRPRNTTSQAGSNEVCLVAQQSARRCADWSRCPRRHASDWPIATPPLKQELCGLPERATPSTSASQRTARSSSSPSPSATVHIYIYIYSIALLCRMPNTVEVDLATVSQAFT